MVSGTAVNEKQARDKREVWTLAAIVLTALVVRALISVLADRVIKWDEPDYLRLGVNLLTGRGFTTSGYPELHYTPLFPIVSAAIGLLVRNLEAGSEVVNVISGSLLLVPVYGIGRRIYGRRVATVASGLLAVLPALTTSVQYWGTMSEPLYILLIYSGIFAVMQAAFDGPLLLYAAAGGFFSLAYLTRPEGITYAAVMLAFIVVLKATRRKLFVRQTLIGLLLFVGVFVLVTFPYMLYLHRHTGQWTVTGKLGVTYEIGAAVVAKDPAEYDRVTASLDSEGKEIIWFSQERFEVGLLEVILGDPMAFLRRTASNARTLKGRFLARTSFSTYLLIPVFLGLFALAWSRERLRDEVFVTLCMAPVLSFLPFHIELRFFSPAFPALLLWTANGLIWLGDWLAATLKNLLEERGHRWEGVVRHVPAVLAALYLVLMQPLAIRDGLKVTNFARRSVGWWMKENTPIDAVIMARDLSIAVYAEREWVPSPHAEYDLYISYARSHGADYLVADEWELTVLRPQLKFLLNTDDPPDDLELAYEYLDEKGLTVVYRIRELARGEALPSEQKVTSSDQGAT